MQRWRLAPANEPVCDSAVLFGNVHTLCTWLEILAISLLYILTQTSVDTPLLFTKKANTQIAVNVVFMFYYWISKLVGVFGKNLICLLRWNQRVCFFEKMQPVGWCLNIDASTDGNPKDAQEPSLYAAMSTGIIWKGGTFLKKED